jgi:hypothetical protein
MHKRQLEIVEPCTEHWSAMKGTSTVRHCTSCSKSVYNMSMLTEHEADAAFAARPAQVCVIYFVDADGEVVFYPSRARRHAARHTLVAALATSALAACAQPTAVEKEAPPVALVKSAVEAPAQLVVSTPAVSTKTSPVVAAVPDTSTPEESKAEDCDPRWKDAFQDAGRSDVHLRNTRSVRGGLRRRYDSNNDVLNPYRK